MVSRWPSDDGGGQTSRRFLGSVFVVGFLDRAKKLAEQAKDKAGDAKDLAQQAKGLAQQAKDLAQRTLDDSRTSSPAGGGTPAPGAAAPSGAAPATQWGTPYVPGMLGRPGWRERGLVDPAAVLPIGERDRAGVDHTTKSQIVEEPFGMGRRWSSGDRSAGLFYPLYPEHRSWEPPGGRRPSAVVDGASEAALDDGRSLVFVPGAEQGAVLEVKGVDADAQAAMARAVADHLAAG
jgi:hypothetical protein